MMEPASRRPDGAALIADVVIICLAIAAAIYFLVDETPEAWLVRLSWAAAIVAGVGIALHALARIWGRS